MVAARAPVAFPRSPGIRTRSWAPSASAATPGYGDKF